MAPARSFCDMDAITWMKVKTPIMPKDNKKVRPGSNGKEHTNRTTT